MTWMTLGFIAGTSQAALSTVDPGLIDGSVDSFVSNRIRLDNDNSQTWKNAIIVDSQNIGGSANKRGAIMRPTPYTSGVTYDYTVSYTAGTGAMNLTVSDNGNVVESLDWIATPDTGLDFLAIRVDGSAPGGGSVFATIDSFDFAGDAGTVNYDYANDFTASPGSTRRYMNNANLLYLTNVLDSGETLTFDGTFVFNYAGSNSKGQKDERTGIEVRLFQGTANVIPAAPTAGLLAFAGIATTRRRRLA
ncbi:MAG: hypothetical protein AAGB34_01105 [Planctomycetota bacterium]